MAGATTRDAVVRAAAGEGGGGDGSGGGGRGCADGGGSREVNGQGGGESSGRRRREKRWWWRLRERVEAMSVARKRGVAGATTREAVVMAAAKTATTETCRRADGPVCLLACVHAAGGTRATRWMWSADQMITHAQYGKAAPNDRRAAAGGTPRSHLLGESSPSRTRWKSDDAVCIASDPRGGAAFTAVC